MRNTHAIFDFYSADSLILAKSSTLKSALQNSFDDYDIEYKNDMFYQFDPFGVTATVVTNKFQLNIHTWPEKDSCTIDFYTSFDKSQLLQICKSLQINLRAKEYDFRIMRK